MDRNAPNVPALFGWVQAKGRSKHMDEWDVSAVVEWFRSIGYVQYDTSIREHQVRRENLRLLSPR